jgi:hypothetical protein
MTIEYGMGTADRPHPHPVRQVMWYVAVTAGLFAVGGYLGRNLATGAAVGWILNRSLSRSSPDGDGAAPRHGGCP